MGNGLGVLCFNYLHCKPCSLSSCYECNVQQDVEFGDPQQKLGNLFFQS